MVGHSESKYKERRLVQSTLQPLNSVKNEVITVKLMQPAIHSIFSNTNTLDKNSRHATVVFQQLTYHISRYEI